VNEWSSKCLELEIPCSGEFALAKVCGEPVVIRKWVIDGLPNDSFSVDNAIVINSSRRWPLLIDPQNQANLWIRKMEEENNLYTCKPTDDYGRKLETCIQMGYPVLLENVGEELDPSLEPLLLRQIIKRGNLEVIKFGESEIEYNKNFKFYITTKLRNPHYLPETTTKVCLLNFMITPEGLQDQLLGIVVAKEKPELEVQRNELVISSAANAKKLKEIEDEILHVLSTSEGNILDDSAAIEVLSASKIVSNEIEAKQKVAAVTEAEIQVTREGYKPTSFHASVLFFCISSLANVDPMYQYSLAWYIKLFENSIGNSEFSHKLEERITNLNDYHSYSLYLNICRSLFGKDKLLFSFILTASLQQAHKLMDPTLWRFFLTGGLGTPKDLPKKPDHLGWLVSQSWVLLFSLNKFEGFEGLHESFDKDHEAWQAIYDNSQPHELPLPGKWNDLETFKKVCIIRCFRSDKVTSAASLYVGEQMGERFTEIPPFDLEGSFKESRQSMPIIFILSPGSDPTGSLMAFAESLNFTDKVSSVSLGQGQGPIAEKLIETALAEGGWVILQNVHLAVSWLTTLERITDAIDDNVAHKDFRLWMTSYPSKAFPVTILQNGIKLTTEPPKGLKNNMRNLYMMDPVSDKDYFFENHAKTNILKKLTFTLSFCHALVQERRNYGPLGWNIAYGFNESDYRISARQLRMFLFDVGEDPTPYPALRYLTGECNYGGRVTDTWDRVLMNVVVESVYNPAIEAENYALTESGEYRIPLEGGVDHYIDHIMKFPSQTFPEVFGMHENADITKDQNETALMLENILNTESAGGGGSGGGGLSRDDTIDALAADILERLPADFDTAAVQAKYPVMYAESMNTVLGQECIRYNKLTSKIRAGLLSLRKALKGLVVMSADLDAIAGDMFNGKIPGAWLKVSYPSLKPLSGYVSNLLERLGFVQSWIDNGFPVISWISGTFFTQSFLTGALQNYARKYKIPVDHVVFDFDFLGEAARKDKRLSPPEDGIYIDGLFLEGARWDYEGGHLAESLPKVLFTPMAVIWLKPCTKEDIPAGSEDKYQCPVYRTLERKGTLSTTGHSTNFVITMRLPTQVKNTHWTKRGCALITMLND